jgi:ElaB/YqjD/DUF883 family membrane-anchored ribosome-binding protein
MEATIRRETENSLSGLGATHRRTEQMIETSAKGNDHKLRAKLEAAAEKTKVVCERLKNQTAAAAKATDKKIREHPYQAVGIAFGLGALIGLAGLLAVRKRRA